MGFILKITFNGVPGVNDRIAFFWDPNYPNLPSLSSSRGNIFKNSRINPGEVARGSDGYTQAVNYYNAFLIDYGSSFSVTQADNYVEIEAINGSNFFDYSCDSGLVVFEVIDNSISNNMIHVINITPRQYAVPSLTARNYLITEDDFLILTENNKKIRL